MSNLHYTKPNNKAIAYRPLLIAQDGSDTSTVSEYAFSDRTVAALYGSYMGESLESSGYCGEVHILSYFAIPSYWEQMEASDRCMIGTYGEEDETRLMKCKCVWRTV